MSNFDLKQLVCTSSQVANFIRNLDPGKATGLDDIGPRILYISPSIAALINKNITSGHFPNQLKIAKVLPIFKNGAKDDPDFYITYYLKQD